MKERVLLTNFRKLSNGCFLINYGEPLNKKISKSYFPNSLDIKIRYTNDFLLHVMLREVSLSTFKIFDVAWGQTRAFCSFDYWEVSKKFLNVFPETNVVLFIYYQIQVIGKVWGKTFFAMRNALLMISMQCDVSPVQTVVIVDDSFNFGSLSFIIMFALKRFIIVDDSCQNHAKRSRQQL